MAGTARLRSVNPDILLKMPWWPTDVSRNLSVRNVNELERPDQLPLSVPSSLALDDYSIGYTLRGADFKDPSEAVDHLDKLERLARLKRPVQLLLADQAMGLFRIESASITILQWAANGQPSVADVSLTLKRASDATINVGVIKRVKGRGKGFAKKKG